MSFLNIFSKNSLQFAPATDGNELFSPIDPDYMADNDKWDLKEPIDPLALDAFWTAVIKDVQKDPEWYSFLED